MAGQTEDSWFNASLFENEKTFNLEDALGTTAYQTFCAAGISTRDGVYVITDTFRAFFKELQTKKCNFTITGAKGVGKSCSLMMLAALTTKPWKFLTSRRCLADTNAKILLSSPPPSKRRRTENTCTVQGDLKQLASTLFSTREKTLILVDLSEWNGAQSDDRKQLVSFLHDIDCIKRIATVRLVVAHSSGSGECADIALSKAVSKIRSKTFVWTPFNRAETTLFLKTHKQLFPDSVTVDMLETLTLSNPGLMEKCLGTDNQMHMSSEINHTVGLVARDLFTEFDEEELHIAIQALRMASSGTIFKVDQLQQLLESKAFSSNLVYLVKDQQSPSESYTVKLSYPNILSHMYTNLKKTRRPVSSRTVVTPTVQGFLFQMTFFKRLVKLELSCIQDADPRVTNDLLFTCSTVISCGPVQELLPNVCYHLTYNSPAIDGVGLFENETDGQRWLVLIQVSLSSYANHKSKAGDAFLQEQKFGDLAGVDDMKVLYLYVTPQHDRAEDLFESGQKSRTRNKYLAVVKKSTSTYKLVRECNILCMTL